MKKVLAVLTFIGMFGAIALQAGAQTPPPDQLDQQKKTLEISKLEIEIAKLRKEAAMGYITPLASVASILALIVVMLVQRATSLQIQKRAEQTSFELKVAELVMTSYSPTAAENRLKLLTGLYSNRLREDFAKSFDPDIYPGTRKHELQFEIYKQLCTTAKDPSEVIEAFRQAFPEEGPWWFDQLFPRSMPVKLSS